ncbi:TPA: restriction endonuclease subunit S [Vibrio parahaemolyticus]|uniref:restriction endonuclease subunit S n=1 Tax=Vibrio parahaemolyticus TaxID=670 RepID=UPI001B813E35|nr:restriction endonuclease subunit S [Vibrio parahaemolyticus]EGQ8110448.1 restriction endonuclease subunit S [Vibrio parahaemolyticus]MCR9718398.1 restriction endonuclease subunit S [Vibrio parahaemolyticus]MCS0049696.1 restriction endonuclease subunit S [Vibrio parahaemolyticus]MDF4306532.1 restriction endonuclease subunit S [Vibrio parahaemolyticus]MDF4566453.1 restriction endonuclease subunit S [Vibrio parahaemolyticus]
MTGRYKAYPEYKKSGVEWLDVIPEHWKVNTVKRLTDFQVGWTPSTGKDDNFVGDNLWANISDLKGKYLDDTAKKISDVAAQVASMDITPKGSLLYSFKLSVGAVSFANKDMYTNEAIASFLSTSKLPLSYLYYSLPIFVIENASTNIYGAKILNQELIKNATLIEPTFQEAEKIANFLDHETAKIDTLINKQEELIKLLKEKRQAVISHAVTKGLNPDAPMKDSGVEWLGDVPEHWDVIFIKHLSRVKRGASPRPIDDPKYFDDNGEYAWTRIADVSSAGMYLTSTTQRLSTLGSSLSVRLNANELFLSIAGTVGKPCITVSKACIHDGFVYFPELKINNKFLYYIFDAGQAYLGLGKMGTQLNLNTDTVGGIKVGLPPKDEIEQIVTHIENQSRKYSELIDRAVDSIELMKERKTALISAAVTGKIDVRDWQEPTYQESA